MAKHHKQSKGKFIIGAIVGAAVGMVGALLAAPKSGKETRQDIKDKAQEVSHDALRQLRKLEGQLNKSISDARRLAGKLDDDARKEAEKLVDRAEKTKDRALKQMGAIKTDTKKQLDSGLMDDIKAILSELDELRQRFSDHRK
jgi:gas vesicle protein